MSLLLILLTVFFHSSNATIEWTPLLSDETGNSPLGFESSQFGTQYGGKGGAPWQEDCDGKGGLKAIELQCGQYVGSIKLLCNDGKYLISHGLGKDRGKGNLQTFFTAKSQITKIVINAAKYVDRITLYNGSKVVLQCGKSTGGKPYSATAPYNGAQLCGFRGRSGWWIDALSVGWCGEKIVPKPTKSGCYVLTPDGCPKQKFNASGWTRDTWGEIHRNAKHDKNACLNTRKAEYNTWCGSKVAKMHWNASPFPKRPTTPGCYVYAPSGCPKQKWNSQGKFVRDSWGIANRNAGASKTQCLVTRKREYNTWCGSADTYMHFVPLKNPTTPGCWVLTPSGCPRQKFNARNWTRDTWGETHRNARWNRNACLMTRKKEYDTWCGANDTKMIWNRSKYPPTPKAPGCYVFAPSNCPKQKWNSGGKYVRDTWGIANRNAGASRSQCLDVRRREYNSWCGSNWIRMHFVAMPRPKTSGCWVLTPTGCPKQKFNAKTWTRDSWGETHRNARWNRNACLVTRKREYDTWCGAKDTQMVWTASSWPKRPHAPGCYVFSPSGCPKQKWNSGGKFVRDTWGIVHRNAGASRTQCLVTRRREYNSWCGSGDTQMHFVALRRPRGSGCWVLTPSGCPKQKFNARTWTKDSWGEKNRNAKWNRNACLVTRKREYDTWCGAKDTQMTWNRPATQNSGCKVVLYQHCGYNGYKHTYTKSTAFVRKGANDQYSAVRLIGCKANQVTLFQHYNWKGKAWTLKGNGDSCFVNNGFNDIVSSLAINKRQWTTPVKPSIGTQVKPTQTRKCYVKFDNKWPHCTNIKCFRNLPLTDVQNQCAANKMCNGFSYTVGAPKSGNGCLKQKCSNVAVNGFGQKSHMYYECTTSTKPTYYGSSQMINDEMVFGNQLYHQEDSDFDEELIPLDTSEFAQVQDENSNSSLLVYSGVFCGFIGGIGLYFAFKKTIDPEREQTSWDYTKLI